jgi:hypothetical protein
MVCLRPNCPLKAKAIASGDRDRSLAIHRVKMTDNVRITVAVLRKASSSVGRAPRCYQRGLSHVRKGVDVPSLIGHAVHNDIGDMAMAKHTRGEDASKKNARHDSKTRSKQQSWE